MEKEANPVKESKKECSENRGAVRGRCFHHWHWEEISSWLFQTIKASQGRQEGCRQGDHLFPLVPLSVLVVVPSLSYFRLFVTPWTAEYQASLSLTISRSLLKLMSIESVIPFNHLLLHFSSCLQSFPASGSFPVSQLFVSGGQSIGASASASVLPMNIQGGFHLGLNSLISLLSEELSRVFSSTTIWKYQFFGFSLLYHVHIIHKTNLCNLMTFSNWTELCPVVSITTIQC